MKINQKIFICALLVLVMLCVIGTASATDESLNDNSTILTQENAIDEVAEPLAVSDSEVKLSDGENANDDLSASDNDEVLGAEITVNNYDELKAAVTSAADGDTIILNDGTYEFPSSGGTITLAKSLTFKGQTKTGVTITSLGTYSIFSATDAYDLKIQNLNFEGIATSGSGIVAIGGTGKLDVVDCNFNNCKAKAGVIRFFGTGDCTINGLTIKNQELPYSSSSSYATALSLTGNAKYTLQTILIDSANYTYSSSYARGVIYISNNAATAIIDCLTIENCGGNLQAIINTAAKTTITNSVISKNNIPGATGNAIIRNSNSLTIEQSIISENTVTNPNGGYLIQDAGSSSVKTTLILKNNNIYDNTVPTKIYYTTNTQYVNSVEAETNYWGDNYETASDVSTATGITQTTWANKNGDSFINQPSGEVNDNIPTPSATPENGDIYVSPTGDDAKDGSSPDNAVQTIKHAIELANDGNGVVIVLPGEYTVNEVLTISKDIEIKSETGKSLIKGDIANIFNNAAKLSLENLKFTSTATGNGAIVTSTGDLTVDNCLFEVDGADASAIYADGGNVKIENSVLLNPTGYALTATSTATVNANNNWWGKNDAANTQASVSSWIVMDASADLDKIYEGSEVTITVSFEKTNDGSDYTGTLPEFDVKITANNLDENLTIKNNQASVKYTVNADDEATITSGSESVSVPLKLYEAPEIIYVNATGGLDTNDGDEAHPVQSIAKAIELAVKGKIIILEGTYAIDNTLTVSNDLDIKGQGTVIIDGNSKRILNNNANLNITNVQFTNGYDSSAVIVNNANLTLNNNQFYSNVNLNGYGASVVRNNKKLVVIDSKFYENKERYGNIYNDAGELYINNTEFYNNDVTDVTTVATGLAIYSDGGNAVIENSRFHDNKGNYSVIYFLSKESLGPAKVNNLTIDNCIFDNNQLVRYGVVYSQKANTTIRDSTFTNNIVKKSSTANGEGSAIYVTGEKVTVETSVFKNNTADDSGKDIYVYAGELDISNSVLINDKGYSIEKSSSAVVDANGNWWGANTPNASVEVATWIVMTVTSNLTDEIKIGDAVEFNIDFTHTNTGAALSKAIPELEVSASALNGEIDSAKLTTKNNAAKFIYTALEGGEDTFTVTSSNAVNTTTINVKVPVILEVIYVSETGSDDNNGTRSSPVATIEHAVEIAQRGKIVILPGQYTIAQTIKLEKDMDIKGEGTVIINGNKTKVFENYANLNLTNIRFTNASAKWGPVVDNRANTLINIAGCEFYSNVATGTAGGIIYINKGSLNLTGSKFYENSIKRGVVSAAADTSLIISGCEFFNHNTNEQNGLIKIDGSDAIIENSIFRNNSIGNGVGIYITSSKTGKTIKINNDTFIDNKATQSSMGNGGAIYVSIASGSVDLTITNSKFINNNAAVKGGAIYMAGNNAKAVVDGCLFINNTANNGNSIYVDNGQQFTISNSVILNDNGIAMNKSSSIHTSKISADNNYWGDNAKANVDSSITVSSWIIMNATYTASEEGVLTITAKFNKTNSTSGEIADYTGKLPDGFDVTFTSTSGLLNEVVTVKDGQASVDYTRDTYLDSEITVKVLNDEIIFPFAVKPSVIYVSPKGNDNNDGDRDTPVASLSKALELAAKGQIVILEGIYKTGDLGIISDDLTITGEGKVVIDAENSNRILYVGEDAKVTLKNLILINGFGAEESGALLGNSNELTIINCTLANSSAGENNGGAIYNVGKLTIFNSTIANNTARIGGAIFTNGQLAKEPTITIENSIIENNIATGNDNSGGGAIFAQQLTGLAISNTTFENNQALTTASGGAIFISHSNANMKITDSRFIANHANGQEQTGGGAIYFAGESFTPSTTGTLTISNTLFENNSADTNGGAIYSRSTKVNVKNSVLINNTDENGISVYGYQTEQVSPSITANENWWGSNDKPSSFIGGNNKYKPTVNNWAILTITNDTEIKDGNTVKLTVAIDSYTDGETVSKMENPITVPVPVTIKTNKGDIEGVLSNGEFTYDLDATGIKYISANADGVEEVLYVNTVATTIIIKDITAKKGDIVVYIVNVTAADGTTIDKGYVELYIAGDLVKSIQVSNGIAQDNIVIAKDVGSYNITAKYIDITKQFADGEVNKTLNVTGINNIVTPENFYNFFDENGYLRDEIPFDELFFKGEFKDMGIVSISKSIKITGEGATFNNTAISIFADDACVSNINFVADKEFYENDGGLIYIGGDNVTLTKNNITYNAPDNVESHAITVDFADNVKITDNNIVYSAKSEGAVETIAVKAFYSDNLVFENNKLDATIPSVPIGYSHYPDNDYYSQGVHIEDSDNLSFNKNVIKVKYNTFAGAYDTIYAVHVLGGDDSRVTDNTIELNGHMHSYGLVTANNQNLTVSGNDINVVSDGEYACGLQVGGDSSAVVDNNNISAKAVNITYPVYLDDWGSETSEVNLTDNNIKGESDTVYGVYVEENKTLISNNTIDVNGNHVYGIVSHQTDMVIDSNDINATGKDIGPIVAQQSGVNENTTGIIVSEGSAKITNNNVVTTGQAAIAAINTNATISNNGLTANGTTADNAIKNINSQVTTSNNTEAKTKDKNTTPDVPVDPVVKIIAKNNAKVDYGFTYQVRVTQDGKSVGAGKLVTLKIAGKTLTAKTDKNGYAKFTLTVKPKAYNIAVTFNKVTQKYKVTVKNVIKAKNLKVKKSAKKLKVKVTLKTSAKKPIKGKKVILKIKGKKIKAKTNKKGVATFTIKKNILKKLKAGKKYKYQVIYGKDTVKKTLKVKK